MVAEKIVIPCPVCGSFNYSVRYEPWSEEADPVLLYGVAASFRGSQRLVECKQCTLVYENPRYPVDVIVQGYMASHDTGHDSQYASRVSSFLRALKKLRRHIPPPGSKVLDVGTASGAFVDAATQFGYEAWGLEPSRLRVSQARERGLRVEQGVIENHPFAPASFDMVTLWDVIEHMPDPLTSLKHVYPLLKPGGILLLNFPDIDTWQARLAGKHFWWIVAAHLTQFSPRTISEISRRAGFQAFHFQPFWQAMEFGYLEKLALTYYDNAFFRLGKRLFPQWLRKKAVPFYASQTTGLARRVG
jgi:SAM-dependent methyltransferase